MAPVKEDLHNRIIAQSRLTAFILCIHMCPQFAFAKAVYVVFIKNFVVYFVLNQNSFYQANPLNHIRCSLSLSEWQLRASMPKHSGRCVSKNILSIGI